MGSSGVRCALSEPCLRSTLLVLDLTKDDRWKKLKNTRSPEEKGAEKRLVGIFICKRPKVTIQMDVDYIVKVRWEEQTCS